jgi:putative DNA primase/helicase
MTHAGIAKVKAFVSRSTDRFRPPYGTQVIEQPRQSIFAGSVNHTDYLQDETGGRRFWPVPCTRIDIDGLAAARDQIWAEALVCYHGSGCWWLDNAELNRQAEEVQRGRYQVDAWEAAVSVCQLLHPEERPLQQPRSIAGS